MNYIKQGVSFFELQLSNQISANAQALYYTLLNINNKCNWKERFTVANSMLTAYTDLNTSAIQRARNELIQLGLIDYKKGKGNQCGEYLLFKLYPDFAQQTDSNVNNKPITNRQQSALQADTLNKQNKTKQNEMKQNKLIGSVVVYTDNASVPPPDDIEISVDSDEPQIQNGKLGKGVVVLSDNQFDSLLEKMPLDVFDYYVEKLADFIIDKKAVVKNHYETILKWYSEDYGGN